MKFLWDNSWHFFIKKNVFTRTTTPAVPFHWTFKNLPTPFYVENLLEWPKNNLFRMSIFIPTKYSIEWCFSYRKCTWADYFRCGGGGGGGGGRGRRGCKLWIYIEIETNTHPSILFSSPTPILRVHLWSSPKVIILQPPPVYENLEKYPHPCLFRPLLN